MSSVTTASRRKAAAADVPAPGPILSSSIAFLRLTGRPRRAGMMKVQTVRIHHHDGGDRGASRLLFDDPGERIENAWQRRATGDHLERALLGGEQRLPPARHELVVEHQEAGISLEIGAPDRRDVQADAHGPLARPIDHGVLAGDAPALGDNLRQGRNILRQRCSVRRDEPQDVVDPGFGLRRASPQRAIAWVLHRRIRPEAGSQRQAGTGSKSRTESSIEGNGAEEGIPCFFPSLRVQRYACSRLKCKEPDRHALCNIEHPRECRDPVKGRIADSVGGLGPWPPAREFCRKCDWFSDGPSGRGSINPNGQRSIVSSHAERT